MVDLPCYFWTWSEAAHHSGEVHGIARFAVHDLGVWQKGKDEKSEFQNPLQGHAVPFSGTQTFKVGPFTRLYFLKLSITSNCANLKIKPLNVGLWGTLKIQTITLLFDGFAFSKGI